MKKNAPIYTLFLIVVFCTSSKGQNKTDGPKNNNKSENDAVTTYGPSSVTRAIRQDRNGNIWIASWEGVFRYDGKSFTNITSGVSSARFFSILADRKGNFWFGSIGSGVYYYDEKSLPTGQAAFQNFTTSDGLFNNEINCIYEDKAGNIWFGVNGGASRYDGILFRNYMMNGDVVNEDKTGKSFPNIRPSKSVNSIVEDKSGNLWFGTTDNTFVYDGKTFTVVANKGKPFTNVRTIIEDKKGNIWLGGEGLWRYDGSTFTNFSHNFVLYVYEDKDGNIWTSSTIHSPDQNWLLSRYEAKSLDIGKPTVTEIKRQVGAIFCILEAYDGSIWFAAHGVYRYDGKTIQEFKSKELQK
jgi:ligand-binding sensor domain-containing protein